MKNHSLQATQTKEQDPRTYAIIGAAMEVHRVLGCGFLEGVYHQALKIEFAGRNIPFESQMEMQVEYKGVILDLPYKADFVCFNEVIVELKALSVLSGTQEAQVLNYLKASNLRVALLLNFGQPSLGVDRFVL